MNATAFFTKNGSVSDSSAIEAELSCFKADTASLYTIKNLLTTLTDTLKKEKRANVQLSPSEPEMLRTAFSFDREQALTLLRDVCHLAARKGDTVHIDVYEKDMHIYYDFYTLASTDALTDIGGNSALLQAAAKCKALLSCEEDSTGKRTISVSFGHADIGTLGFKTDGTKKRLPRW